MQYGNDKNQQLRDDLRAYAHVNLHEHDEDQVGNNKVDNVRLAEAEKTYSKAFIMAFCGWALFIAGTLFIKIFSPFSSSDWIVIGSIRFASPIIYLPLFIIGVITIVVLNIKCRESFLDMQKAKGIVGSKAYWAEYFNNNIIYYAVDKLFSKLKK